MSTSDFFAVMTLGMSTVAGSVLVLYASVLNPVIETAVSQIVAASLLNIIGALYISRLFEPETVSDISYEETTSSLNYEHHGRVSQRHQRRNYASSQRRSDGLGAG